MRTFGRRVASALTGRLESPIVRALADQLEATDRGAELACALVDGSVAPQRAKDQMTDVEHEGDNARGRLVDALAHTVAPPIDREDLFRVSRSIDDVLDTLRDFVREAWLYQVDTVDPLRPLLSSVVVGIATLQGAVEALTSSPRQVPAKALRAKKTSGETRRQFQHETAKLLTNGVATTEALRVLELARRIDEAAVKLGEASNALADGALKRWH
jgi:uncharacterized protein